MSDSEFDTENEFEGFTTVNPKRQQARKARNAAQLKQSLLWGHIPGALWTDAPLHRCHLPGIPYSYYDDEIVMIRERTAAWIARQCAEADAFERMRRRKQQSQNGEEDYYWHQVKSHEPK